VNGLVDTHCHLAHIEREVAEVLAEANEAGVDLVVDVGMGTAESRAAADRAEELPAVRACVGVHPNDLAEFETDPDGTMAMLAELASRPAVVAIGETGLDFYRDRTSRDLQDAAFRASIALAKRADRALVIHCRDAHDAVLDVLDYAGAPSRVVMHCFSGDTSYARECAARGFFCSFAGNITYKRNDELRDAARAVPHELLLVETDAPFLTPAPFRGKPNAPALVVHTAEALAATRSMSVNALTKLVSENARRAFVI
jgi:TatD DNase family protein